MDENLARLNRIYPNSKYVQIPKYEPSLWENRPYDSAYDTKSPLTKWKTQPLSYEEAQAFVEKGFRIGWVVPKGFCVIDIDNKDDSRTQEYVEKILQKFQVAYSYNYTSKGCHLVFQDPSKAIKSDSRCKCGLNLVVDTRANETGYIILPSNDPHRAWGEWNDFVEDVPYFLYPLFKDNTPSFIGMKEGDGRNNALFIWRSRLEKKGKELNAEKVEKCIRIINEYLFDTPMQNSELFKTVLKERDEKAKEPRETKENVYNKYADEIVAKYDVVSRGSQFYKFNGTYYKKVYDVDIEKLIHYEINQNISQAGRKEIMEFLRIKTQVAPEDFDKDWHKISCKNGIINLITGDIETPTKADINTIYIPFNYSKDPVYSPRIDQFMKELTGGDFIKMEFLYQIAGYCLLKKNIFEKFVICKGEGGTGKSTYTNLLCKLVGGDDNCSHIGLAEFDKDYYLSTTIGKLLNIDDDVVDGRALENTGRFKSIVSGNIISVRQIYKEVCDYVPFVTCVFSCNRLPRIMDKTSGLYRRMILIELSNKVEHPDPMFMSKVTDQDMEYMLYKAVEGIKTAIEEGKFRVSQSEKDLLQIFKRRQSAIHEWLFEQSFRLGELDGKKCIVLYKQFKEWCDDNGYNKIPNNFTFCEDVCTLYNMEMDMAADNPEDIPTKRFVKRGEYDPNFRPF